MVNTWNRGEQKFFVVSNAQEIMKATIRLYEKSDAIPKKHQWMLKRLVENARTLLYDIEAANNLNLNDPLDAKERLKLQYDAKIKLDNIHSDLNFWLMYLQAEPKSLLTLVELVTKQFKPLSNWLSTTKSHLPNNHPSDNDPPPTNDL